MDHKNITSALIKEALESLNNPNVYSQALVDCRNLLNLSLDTLLAHFQSWLWFPDDEAPDYDVGEQAYYLELSKIEEYLCIQGLIYN